MDSIKELYDGQHIQAGQYLLTALAKCVNNKGKAYLNLTLQDATGSIDGKKWEVEPGDEEIFVVGNVLSVQGEVLAYQDHLQMKVVRADVLPDTMVDPGKFVPAAPESKEAMIAELKVYLHSLQDPAISAIVKNLIIKHKDKFFDHPAAVRNHHAFASGLLYHSLCMARIAEQMCKIYPSLNRDILIGACLIHDLGKVVELSGAIATKYTLEGKLIGHICWLSAEIREAAKELNLQEDENALLLEHMILSHHGKQEFGAAMLPSTREALALSMIDDFDAKMETLNVAFAQTAPGEWSARIPAMENRSFYYPLYNKKDQ